MNQAVIKSAPKGSAYTELMEMIGLDEAKKIIRQVLAYAKAQKVFSEKGMASDHLSMHMVFYGNPMKHTLWWTTETVPMAMKRSIQSFRKWKTTGIMSL